MGWLSVAVCVSNELWRFHGRLEYWTYIYDMPLVAGMVMLVPLCSTLLYGVIRAQLLMLHTVS